MLFRSYQYRAVIDSPNVTFERVSPVKYRVSFSHVSRPQELALLQNFNKDWKIFLEPDAHTVSCTSITKNTYSNNEECLGNMSLLQNGDVQYLWKPPLFESSHRIKFGYANSWEISTKEIQANYPNSYYYSVNADGSLNFTLTVYYWPEIWYLLSVLLSLTSGIAAVTVIMFRLFARLKKPFYKNLV